jgi:hypothetical protein
MKHTSAGKLEGRKSSGIVSYVPIFIVCLALVILVCSPLLLPLLAMVILPRLIGDLGEFIGGFLVWFFWVVAFIAYAIGFLLNGDWGQLVGLLPELLDWLRSVDLL